METLIIKNPFKTGFLSSFVMAPNALPFTDKEIIYYDHELSRFEQVFLNPEIEKNLISKNELLASFAISKAELSSLTLPEAQEVYNLIISNSDYDFIGDKLKKGKKLTQKDYDKLEFFNIAKTFRFYNQSNITFQDINSGLILEIHQRLTQGLDIFKQYLPDFTVYKSGRWRDNDEIRVGEYIPSPYQEIESGVIELINWLKKNQTPTGVTVFHTCLYSLHPFNNGNKRVCRVLEHLLFRQLGLNKKNLYSTSYYYHKEKPRYYKHLLYSLERKNLNHFVAFVQEAIICSMISVIKTSLEAKRSDYWNKKTTDATTKSIIRPLIKRKELQFKHLFKFIGKKMARQTFVTYLQKAVQDGIIIKKDIGRSTYYRFNTTFPEEAIIKKWLIFVKARLDFIPDEYLLV